MGGPSPDLARPLCTAAGPTRGSAIALSPDETRLAVVNRDVGTVTILSVDYSDGFPKMTVVKELAVGAEPAQVAIEPCGMRAFVVLRKDQSVVAIEGFNTAAPTVGAAVSVGSEPTALALTPNGTRLYVSNWVDGTLSVIDPVAMKLTGTVDLNPALANTGALGSVAPRAALAHPRAIAITNNGDTSDADETVYVTEWYAIRLAPESAANLAASDTNWQGVLYKVPVMTGAPTILGLPPVADTGFNDAKGNKTGCFPNQVAAVTIDSGYAYVTSTCASPVGPLGVFQKGSCALDSQCPGGMAGSCVNGACKGICTVDSDCGVGSAMGACNVGTGVCAPLTANAKTTTHPAVTILDLTAGTTTTTTLDTLFAAKGAARMPLLPSDIDFTPGSAYVSAVGADGLFRLVVQGGAISGVGSATNNFINTRTPADPVTIRLPLGVAVAKLKAFAFVANEGTRDVTAIDLNTQAVAVGAANTDYRVTTTTALPTAGSAGDHQLRGKRFFTTGVGRWSLAGAAWGSCAACHFEGLSDGVTWYFARGPRQTLSLDGSYASKDATDQRIFNWTAIFDEVADFEGNVRGTQGGVGALVTTANQPCTVATETTDCPNSLVCDAVALICTPSVKDRINLFTQVPQQQGLQGSSDDIANPTGASGHPHSVLSDWGDIGAYIQNIRSPRRPTNLVAADVAAGKVLFAAGNGNGNCVGCHSGAKWTISKRFYTPGDVPNDAFTAGASMNTSLSAKSWSGAVAGFPASLYPSTTAGKQTMRSGAPTGFEQIQCILRPVGTIQANGPVPLGVSPPAVNVLELRQDMVTGAQGAGGTSANDFTVGYNPPSLLGLQLGAPYFHAGNARTLEETFSGIFAGHYQSALAPNFNPSQAQVRQLTAYLLSIDEDEPPTSIPPAGAGGGDICAYP